MNAAPCKSVQIRGQSRNKRFTFTRSHLGDSALMQRDAADQLHVKMAHSRNSDGRFSYGRKGFGQNFVQNILLFFAPRVLVVNSLERIIDSLFKFDGFRF